MIDLVHIWNDNKYRSKVSFIITSTHAYDLKVKVTDLEILYLIPDNVKFMTTNDQTKAQEILSLSIRTDRTKQTVETKIRLVLKSSLIRVYTVCDSVCTFWTKRSSLCCLLTALVVHYAASPGVT